MNTPAERPPGPAERYRIVEFGAGIAPDAAAITGLHSSLMPHSPVVLLGGDFMRQFYYQVLPQMNLISGAVAYIDAEPAGFIVATADSEGFMRQAVARHGLRLAWLLGRSALLSPRRMAALWEALQIMRHRGAGRQAETLGELLSFGVLEAYRSMAFVRRTGVRISVDLLDVALRQLRSRAVARVRCLVDEDNVHAKLFYRALGWQLTAAHVPGWRTPQVEFQAPLTSATEA